MPINIDVRVNNSPIKELVQDLRELRSLQSQTNAMAGGGGGTPAGGPAGPVGYAGPAFSGLGSPGPVQAGGGPTGPAPVLPSTPNTAPTGPQPVLGGGGGSAPSGGGGGRPKGGGGISGFLGRTGIAGFARGFLKLSVFAGGTYLAGNMLRQMIEGESSRELTGIDIAQRLDPRQYGRITTMGQGGENGFGAEEATRFLDAMSGAGTRNLGRNFSGVRAAERLTRDFGFSPNEGGMLFGSAARDLGGASSMERFAEQFATAVNKGQMSGLQGEVFKSILEINSEISRRMGSTGGDLGTAGMSAQRLLSMTAVLNRSNIPSFSGGRGLETLSAMESSVRGNNIFQLPNVIPELALTAGGRMGMNPMQIALMQEQGFGNEKYGQFLSNMMQTAQKQFGGPMSQLIMSQQLGVPMGSEALTTLMNGLRVNSNYASTEEGKRAVGQLNKEAFSSSAAGIRQEQAAREAMLAKAMEDLLPAFLTLQKAITDLTYAILHPLGTLGSVGDAVSVADDKYFGGTGKAGLEGFRSYTRKLNKYMDPYPAPTSGLEYYTLHEFLGKNRDYAKTLGTDDESRMDTLYKKVLLNRPAGADSESRLTLKHDAKGDHLIISYIGSSGFHKDVPLTDTRSVRLGH